LVNLLSWCGTGYRPDQKQLERDEESASRRGEKAARAMLVQQGSAKGVAGRTEERRRVIEELSRSKLV